MKKTIYIAIAAIVVVLALVLVLRVIVGGDEDTWICENGTWVKHGAPSEPMPTGGCGNANNATTNSAEALADLSDQFNWSTMTQGPYRDKVTYATSNDLVTWSPRGVILAEHASVPGAVVKDGTIFVYFVNVSTDGIPEQLGMVKSDNEGATWSKQTTLTINGIGNRVTADPDPVLLSDGRIRLYYFDINEARLSKPANGIEPTNKIYSAISTDGVNFTQEDGVRFEYRGVYDPDVNLFGGTWYLYAGDVGGNRVIYATSTDGLTFTYQGIAYSGGAVPDVFLSKGTYYLYTAGIGIATSTTPTSFTSLNKSFNDSNYKITADPSVVPLNDEFYLMLYKVQST